MFDLFKKKHNSNTEVLGAPIEGEAVASADVPDPTFAEEMLGKGMAIRPLEGKVFSPVDGEVTMVFDTKHAITVTSSKGAEILIHVGLDTVTLKGSAFTAHVSGGQAVKKGDLLLEFDMEAIKAAGLELISPIIICNSDDYKDIKRFAGKQVKPGDDIMELEK